MHYLFSGTHATEITGTDRPKYAAVVSWDANLGLRLQTSTQWGAIKKIIATQPGVRYRVKLGYVHGGSVGGGMEVYNGGVESTQSIGGSGWLNKTTERVFEFVPDSDMVMLKFFSGEVTGVDVNLYLSKVEISIANSNHYSRIRGDKTYELSNHLGNVLATITDRKLGFSNNTSNNFATHYQAEVTSATDYYPFGSQMPDRSVSSDKARYGFQNQEKDNEIKGEGNSINYKYRMHDPRLGRFFAVDPLADEYPWNSSYAFSENRVISAIELEGLEAVNLFSVDDNLWKAAESNPDKSVVHIYGHANPNYIRDNSPNGNKAKINSGKVLEKVLNDNGILLETKKVFIFHACRSSSVAKLISSSDEFKDKIIVAPVERLTIKIRAIKDNETGEFIRYDFIENAYLPLLDSKGELVKDKDGKVVNTTEKANFQAFKNGELIWEGKIEDIKYSSLLEYTEENKKLGSFQKDKK